MKTDNKLQRAIGAYEYLQDVVTQDFSNLNEACTPEWIFSYFDLDESEMAQFFAFTEKSESGEL